MKSKIFTLIFSLCALAALTTSVSSSAQAPMVFDAPGAATVSSPECAPYCGTMPFANNDLGVIVGFYTDEYVVPHAFLRKPDGEIISFDAPGAGLGQYLDQGTVAFSINDLGVIAGQYQDSNNVWHGFVRYPDGSFTTFDAPWAGTGAYQGTYACVLNLEGETAGWYTDASNVTHGFVRSPFGKFTSFDPPGSVATYPCTQANGINNEGAVTGYYLDATNTYNGFVREPNGKITEFHAPNVIQGGYNGTIPLSIDDLGVIGGYFHVSNGVAHAFVRYPDGTLIVYDDPNAGEDGTFGGRRNLWGASAGGYADVNNVGHAFYRAPDGKFTNFDAPGAGKGAYPQGTVPYSINAEGEVIGFDTDAINLNHGFLWRPSQKH
jgi:hypothetical protein